MIGIVQMEKGGKTMYESRKKLPCTCGRKQLETWVSYDGYKEYCQIKCPKCGLKTDKCPSEIAAIRAWNRLVTETLAKAITEYKEEEQ